MGRLAMDGLALGHSDSDKNVLGDCGSRAKGISPETKEGEKESWRRGEMEEDWKRYQRTRTVEQDGADPERCKLN